MADRGLLARATDGSQAPTPGYLYLDIAKNVAASPMACQEAATYLTRRLASKNNANVKYKCLKVISKIAESPVTRGQFKRTLAQDANSMSSIKEALQYRGPPDPARGDEPYQKVRTAAKEALDAVYSDAPTSQDPMVSMAGGGGSTGMRKMEGIGNPMFQDPRLQQDDGPMTAEKFVKEASQTIVAMYRDPLAKNVPTGGPPRSTMQGFGSHTGGYPPGRSQLQAQTNNQWTMASNRGLDAVTNNPSPASTSSTGDYYKDRRALDWASKSGGSASVPGGVGGSWGAPPSVASSARVTNTSTSPAHPPAPSYGGGVQTSMGQAGTAISDGQYEKQLIMELCPPSGLKAEPPPDKLQRFAQAIPSLNPDLVCPALLDCLEEGQPWIIRAKSLCVMETCITLGVGEDGINRYADFFFECRDEVEPLANHNRPAISQPARRVLELLGIGVSASTPSPAPSRPRAAPAAAAPAPPPPDLLDFGDSTPAPAAPAPAGSLFDGLSPAAPPPAAPAPPAPAPSGSLFDGLSTTAPAPAPPAPASTGSLFGGLNVAGAAPAPPPAPDTGGGSAFGFMGAAATTPATPSSSASEAKQAAASSGFGFMQETPKPAAAPAPPSSGFGFLQQATPPPASAPPSSGFGFMGGAGAGDNVIAAPTGPKPTFDPLSQNYKPSPTSQKQVMHQPLNPAQLQAMYAQQQNMMMMQQQQQMQFMALQQQQQFHRGSNLNVMAPGSGMAATTSFSFLDISSKPPAKQEDKKFDFVQLAMNKEKK